MTSKIEGVSPHCNTTSLDEPDFGTDIFISPFLISFVIIFFRHTDIFKMSTVSMRLTCLF